MPVQCDLVSTSAFAKLLVLVLFFPLAIAAACPSYLAVKNELGALLSNGSFIANTTLGAPRWSLYGAPSPSYVVNVASEQDVAITVKFCNKYNYTFVAQNGGNGWADTFDLGKCGLIINIGGLQQISFNAQKTQATIQGGAQVDEMINAAYTNNARFANPTCSCLGFLGAVLGGGLTRMMGLYGTGVDQLLSVSLVMASGEAVQVNRSDSDLWWALGGAAPNFGIVTSAIIKAYPVPAAQNMAWQGSLTFSDDKLESLIQTVNDLDLKPHMQIDFLFSTSGPPLYSPMISAIPIFLGNTSAAEVAFAPILKLGPTSNEAQEIPYSQWSNWSESFCQKGGRKPAYGASLAQLDPETWRAVFEEFKAFIAANPGTGNSSILAENYPLEKAIEIGSATSSYPFRNIRSHVVAIPWYTNASFDATANAFGSKVRDLWRATDGLAHNSTYINFAHGDESLPTIYGTSLSRLQDLKKRYDPYNRFNQWFPLA